MRISQPSIYHSFPKQTCFPLPPARGRLKTPLGSLVYIIQRLGVSGNWISEFFGGRWSPRSWWSGHGATPWPGCVKRNRRLGRWDLRHGRRNPAWAGDAGVVLDGPLRRLGSDAIEDVVEVHVLANDSRGQGGLGGVGGLDLHLERVHSRGGRGQPSVPNSPSRDYANQP